MISVSSAVVAMAARAKSNAMRAACSVLMSGVLDRVDWLLVNVSMHCQRSLPSSEEKPD